MCTAMAEPQRAVITSPEGERGVTWIQLSDLAVLETNHQSARRHLPTLTPQRQPDHPHRGLPSSTNEDEGFY